MLTSDQIARVSAWCHEKTDVLPGPHYIASLFADDLSVPAMNSWRTVGIVAEAAKAAGVVFYTPHWAADEDGWWSECADMLPVMADSPAAAAILAANAYLLALEQKGGADHERA